MNKKGFTLVELIAVIAVLGMVVGFATYGVTTLVKKAQDKTRNEAINNLKDAAITYCIENHFSKKVTTPCTVKVGDLISDGVFDDKEKICSKDNRINNVITVTIEKVSSDPNSKAEDYKATIPDGTCQ